MKIIIYVVDCLRADHVSCYGYHRNTTPHIDSLARDGILFEDAYSPSTWTKPVAASLLTGLYPPVHGVRMRRDVMRRDIQTLPELLHDHDYRTLAISTIGNVSSSLGFGRGFDRFIDLYKDPSLLGKRAAANVAREKLFHETDGNVIFPLAEDINNAFFPWLDDHLDQDFFAFLWAMDPHDPYDPPSAWRMYSDREYKGRMDGTRELARRATKPEDLHYLMDLYDGEISYTDHCFGQLVSHLHDKGIYDETAIFVLADHGEAFGDHGHMSHGHLPFEEIIRVPLIAKLPGSAYSGQRVPGLVSLIDIMPTVFDLAHFPSDEMAPRCQGCSLIPAIEGRSVGTHRALFSETQATEENNALYSVRSARWKYMRTVSPDLGDRVRSVLGVLTNRPTLVEVLRNPLFYLRRQAGINRDHLYRIFEDPQESENLAKKSPRMVAQLQGEISNWQEECARLAREYQTMAEQFSADEETLENLRALGYI